MKRLLCILALVVLCIGCFPPGNQNPSKNKFSKISDEGKFKDKSEDKKQGSEKIQDENRNDEESEKKAEHSNSLIKEKDNPPQEEHKSSSKDGNDETPRTSQNANAAKEIENTKQISPQKSVEKKQSEKSVVEPSIPSISSTPTEPVTPVEKDSQPSPEPQEPSIACNDDIPPGCYLNDNEASAYAEEKILNNLKYGDGTITGYSTEIAQTECGTIYYILEIY